jgi:hypothetical protein
VVELRLHGENSVERRLGEPEGLRVNQGMSGATDDEAEPTEATGVAMARRRP